jgi:hypothetical protein
MTTVSSGTTSRYRFQDSHLLVTSDDAALAAAVDYRFRDCRQDGGSPDELALEYVTGSAVDGQLPTGDEDARVIYETPAGSVSYSPDRDVISALFGTVHMWSAPAKGVVRMWSERYTPDDRYLAAHPLTMVALCELLKRRGRLSLHAACVSGPRQAALIAGPSGVGKSTLVLALATLGFRFGSDDMVFMEPSDGGVLVHGFSDSIGVMTDTAARFEALADLAHSPPPLGFRKHLIRIEERFQVQTIDRCRPGALVFPERVAQSESRIEPMSAAEAWLRLVPNVLLTHPTATQSHLAAIAGLTEQVACYRLCSGTDVISAARLIGELLT